ncbi:Uncharacterized protein Rs2_46348 [Raphanus sativus]|nr:Uncharacterized protein Rs2_46348 [Raphanus sativus]
MVEDTDSQWVKVAERGSKRSVAHRRKYRGDSDVSRQMVNRREGERFGDQEGPERSVPGLIRDQNSLSDLRVEAKEEGEISTAGESLLPLPSQEFQEQLTRTQATGSEVISDPLDTGSIAVSNKMRAANALVFPRKCAAAKISKRHGDNNKPPESKGTSNLMSGHQ